MKPLTILFSRRNSKYLLREYSFINILEYIKIYKLYGYVKIERELDQWIVFNAVSALSSCKLDC